MADRKSDVRVIVQKVSRRAWENSLKHIHNSIQIFYDDILFYVDYEESQCVSTRSILVVNVPGLDQAKGPRTLPSVSLTRASDLFLQTSPFRAGENVSIARTRQIRELPRLNGWQGYLLVYAVDVIVSLNGDARAATHSLPVLQALGALERGSSIEPVTRVDNEAGLVGPKLSLDSGKWAGQGSDDGVLGRVLRNCVSLLFSSFEKGGR